MVMEKETNLSVPQIFNHETHYLENKLYRM